MWQFDILTDKRSECCNRSYSNLRQIRRRSLTCEVVTRSLNLIISKPSHDSFALLRYRDYITDAWLGATAYQKGQQRHRKHGSCRDRTMQFKKSAPKKICLAKYRVNSELLFAKMLISRSPVRDFSVISGLQILTNSCKAKEAVLPLSDVCCAFVKAEQSGHPLCHFGAN